MIKSNLLDGGSTNIKLSSSAYEVLVDDCYRFGFIKNDKPNITYIISRLIKELTEYRNDLHDELLKNNNYDKKIVKTIENNIFNIYLKTLNYICDDSYIDVGYRISREFLPYIQNLFYETLEKFNMDFTSYVRSLIYEYCSRTESQRELFLFFTLVKEIKKEIKKEHIVNIVNDGIQNELILVSIEIGQDGLNYLLGLTSDRKMCLFLPLCKTKYLKSQKIKMNVSQDEYDKIIANYYKFLEENN